MTALDVVRWGPDYPDALVGPPGRLPGWFADAAPADILAPLEAAVADATDAHGPQDATTLAARVALTYALVALLQRADGDAAVAQGDAGGIEAAGPPIRDRAQQLVRHAGTELGLHHPVTLRARGVLAASLAVTGRTTEAIVRLRALVDDSNEGLGVCHPFTLRCREALAALLERSGAASEGRRRAAAFRGAAPSLGAAAARAAGNRHSRRRVRSEERGA